MGERGFILSFTVVLFLYDYVEYWNTILILEQLTIEFLKVIHDIQQDYSKVSFVKIKFMKVFLQQNHFTLRHNHFLLFSATRQDVK